MIQKCAETELTKIALSLRNNHEYLYQNMIMMKSNIRISDDHIIPDTEGTPS